MLSPLNAFCLIGLRFLRDYPPEYSTVKENYKSDDYPEYTATPSLRPWTAEDQEKVIRHFEQIFHSRTHTLRTFDVLPEPYRKGFQHI